MVQEDTCSTSEAIDCERNVSVTSRIVLARGQNQRRARAFQRAVGEKGPGPPASSWAMTWRRWSGGRWAGMARQRGSRLTKVLPERIYIV